MRTVAVWKRAWLPPSETFVRNQIDYLQEWEGIAFGVQKVESLLSKDSDVILFGSGFRERLALSIFRLRGHSPRVTRFLRENAVDVVHAHFGYEAATIWRQCRKSGIPLVVTLHGHDISAGPSTRGLIGWRYRRRLRSVFTYATRVIAVSQFVRQLALAQGADGAKTAVRYIGIPIPQDTPRNIRPTWDIAFVGRLTSKKGVDDLLIAVERLASEGLTASVVIVGSGPLDEGLRQFAIEKNLQVDFLGHQGPERVREVLADSRIFVAPSKRADDGDAEGFGLVFLEAAAAGLPVVSYAHGGVVEAVESGQTGILCPEGDVSSLSFAIGDLLRHPDRAATMGAAGRDRVKDRFDIRRTNRGLEDVYSDSLRRR